MSFSNPWIFPNPKLLTYEEGHFLEYNGMEFIRYQSDPDLPREGYILDVDHDGIHIRHSHPAGAFYAVVTIKQLIRQYKGMLPFVHIEDKPDFPHRGVLLDIGRNKIPAMESFYRLIDILSELKINQLHLYMEGYCFKYKSYVEHFPEETPITSEEYRLLDAYAAERFIELVPTQNCFGHMAPWLALQAFKDLAENPDGFELIPGLRNPPSVLNPLDLRSLQLVTGMFDELLPNFTSPNVNICFDEPFELGLGKSGKACAEKGIGAVYLEFLEKVCSVVAKHGKRPMVWGDIITKHPEMLKLLPQEITILDWNYEGMVSFEDHCKTLRDHGIDYYVCPGTSSWCSIAGRTSNMKMNLCNAAEQGQKYGAKGYLITDWGDMGHCQAPVISYPGYAYGAAVSWNLEGNRDADIAHYLNTFIYEDQAEVMGKMALALGDYAQYEGVYLPNGTLTFGMLALIGLCGREEAEYRIKGYLSVTGQSIGDTSYDRDFCLNFDVKGLRGLLEQAGESIGQSQMKCREASLIVGEYLNTIRLLSNGADLMDYIQREDSLDRQEKEDMLQKLSMVLGEFIGNYEKLWRMRNREGGLKQSMQQFFILQKQYADKVAQLAKV